MKHYLQNSNHNGILELVSHYENCIEHLNFEDFDENDFLHIADHYHQENFPQEALLTIERGIAAFPRSKKLKAKQIRLLIHLDHHTLAMKVLAQKDQNLLESYEIDLLKAESMIQKKEYENALSYLKLLERRYQLPRIRSDIFVLEALAYEKMGEYDMVYKTITEALYYSPTHENALMRMLFCLEFTKMHKESIQFHQELLQKEHYSALTWYNLGHSFYHEFMYEEAIEAFEFAYIIDSNLEHAYYYCAELYLLRGIYSKALNCYEEMLDKFQIKRSEVYQSMGECLLKTGNPIDALAKLDLAWAIEEDPNILILKAKCLRVQGNIKDAISTYQEVLQMDNMRDDAHVELALLYFHICEFERSKEHFKEAVEIAPFESGHWIQYASLYMNIGEVKKAELILFKGKEETYCPRILYCQAACLILMGKKKMGMLLLDEALQLDIGQQDILFEFAYELEDNSSVKAILKYYNGN